MARESSLDERLRKDKEKADSISARQIRLGHVEAPKPKAAPKAAAAAKPKAAPKPKAKAAKPKAAPKPKAKAASKSK